MRIDVWSDLVCPWCYIGKRRLEHALEQAKLDTPVEVVHRSFQLNPAAPAGKTSPRRDYLMKKYGWSPAQADTIDTDMEARAAVDGLEYHLGAAGLTGNTFDAHRLMHLARDRGVQDAASSDSSAATSPSSARCSTTNRWWRSRSMRASAPTTPAASLPAAITRMPSMR